MKKILKVTLIVALLFLLQINILSGVEQKHKHNSLVKSNNKFGFDLYDQIRQKNKNVFVSPYSISSALLMVYEGAKGKTAEEMKNVLHVIEDRGKIRSDYKNLVNKTNSSENFYKLRTANALWTDENYPFVSEYVKAIKEYYLGKVTNMDFQNKTEESRQTINNWVKDKTEDKIKDIIPAGMLNPMTVSVLTNAIYFKADWIDKFQKELTREEEFTLSSGDNIITPFMHNTDNFKYGENDDLQILEMDYVGGEISMIVLLPKENDICKIEGLLNQKSLRNWKNSMSYERVNIALPKFKFRTKYFLADQLKKMGMTTAFIYPQADFRGISPTGELFISEVIHQTFVEVAEYGTEAAAATAVMMKAGAAPQMEQPKVFRADHPFIFIIQQKDSGNILFMGKLCNPNE